MFSTPFPGLENESVEALCSCQQRTVHPIKMERLNDVHYRYSSERVRPYLVL